MHDALAQIRSSSPVRINSARLELLKRYRQWRDVVSVLDADLNLFQLHDDS